MARKRTAENKQRTIGLSVSIGLGTEVVISLIGAMIVTTMLISETVSVGSMKFLTLIIQFFATAFGGMIACTLVKGKYALTAGLTAALYCFLLIAMSILIYDSAFGSVWTSLLAIGLGYATSCTICIMKTTNTKSKKHRYC